MAYKIEYGYGSIRQQLVKKDRGHVKSGKWLVLLAVIAAVLCFRLYGIPDFLIPGNADVTRAAASNFIEHVQTGMPVGEAVTAFCLQIIDGAGL